MALAIINRILNRNFALYYTDTVFRFNDKYVIRSNLKRNEIVRHISLSKTNISEHNKGEVLYNGILASQIRFVKVN